MGLGADVDRQGEPLVYGYLNVGLSDAQPVAISTSLIRQHFINCTLQKNERPELVWHLLTTIVPSYRARSLKYARRWNGIARNM